MKYRKSEIHYCIVYDFLGGNKLKKVLFIGMVIIALLIPGVKVVAEEEGVKSKGGVGGIINFYGDDIKYLLEEIKGLLEECREDENYE